MITIKVNDNLLEIKRDFNLLQLLQQLDTPQGGIAVAINDTIVLKDLWASKTLSNNDAVLIIQATQGG